ncbi:hypothetical protein [Candidatus Leptofilum sp.]|uniref:hypothetical protein n=1 Tax=Candidatus Leptofilum sp. TaxID=3241576 RepID=UPI003B5C88A4
MIEARVTLTKEIVLQGFLLHAKYRQRFIKILPYLGGLLVIFAIVNISQVGSLINVMPLLLPGLFMMAVPSILQQLAKRNASRVPILGSEMVWQLNKQGLTGQTPAREFSQAWMNMEDALISDAGILLYTHRVVSHWLPRNAFATDADFEQAKQFIQNGVRHHQTV